MKLMKFDSSKHQVTFDSEGVLKVYRRKKRHVMRNLTTGMVVDRVGDTLVEDIKYDYFNREGLMVFEGDEYRMHYLWTLEDITERIDWDF